MTTPGRLPYPVTLSGDGITLREWRDDDLDELVAMLDEPDIARWTPMPSPFDIEAGVAYLKRARQGRLSGQRIQLGITTDGAKPLGEVLLFGVDAGLREAELGYLVGAQHRRRGLAAGALSLLSAYARSTLKLTPGTRRAPPWRAAAATASPASRRSCRRARTAPAASTRGSWSRSAGEAGWSG